MGAEKEERHGIAGFFERRWDRWFVWCASSAAAAAAVVVVVLVLVLVCVGRVGGYF